MNFRVQKSPESQTLRIIENWMKWLVGESNCDSLGLFHNPTALEQVDAIERSSICTFAALESKLRKTEP